MSYDTIEYSVQDGVAIITLNRPELYNALNQLMYQELLSAFETIRTDKAVRAVILTGNGKGFCSGADLVELNSLMGKMSVGEALRNGLNRIIMTIRNLEKPVICAINGVAAGAGSSLTLACDIRLVSDKASFVFAAFVNIGIIPDGGATYLLPQLVGVPKALELALFADAGNRLSPELALEYGIANRVVPAEDLMTEAHTLAIKLAKMATHAIGMTKQAMYRAITSNLPSALEYEAQVQEGTFKTKDFAEGVQAFIQKRPANFTGE